MRVMVTVHIWTEEDLQQVLREEVEITVPALKKGKSAVDTSRTCSSRRGVHD